jgi:CheY-like chemotaxis protein
MLTSRKILIVEEHRDLLDLLGEALGLLGWETILAESGREAMNELEHDLPSFVFLDLGTPLMNGIELAASLKAHPVYKDIPILAAGGHSGDLIRKLCLAAGCDDFISKPLVFAELEMRLNSLWFLERRKIICAGEPMNLGSNGWKLSARGGGRRQVA